MSDAALLDAWDQLGFMTKLGLVSQAATCGLLIASIRQPSRRLAVAALLAAILGLFGLSLSGIGEAEYTICGALERPGWCGVSPIVTSSER